MTVPVIEKFNNVEAINELAHRIRGMNGSKSKIHISPLPDSAKTIFIKKILNDSKRIVLLFPKAKLVNETKVELNLLGLGDLVVTIDEINPENIQEKLTKINNKENFILLATYEILKITLPSKKHIEQNTTKIEVGADLSYDYLIEYLSLLNYNREKYVDAQGEFAVRGSIIDFWSYSEKYPCRLEYDGDFLESIRYFDTDNQRSSERIEYVTLASSLEDNEGGNDDDIFDYIDNPLIFASSYELSTLFKKKEKAPEVLLDDREELDEDLKKEIFEDFEVEEEAEVKEEVVETSEINSLESLFSKSANWVIEEELSSSDDKLSLGIFNSPVINSNFELLFNILRDYASNDYQIIFTAENELQGRRLLDLLTDFRVELNTLIEKGIVRINVLAIKEGFHIKSDKLLVLTDYQVFNKPYRTKISSKQKRRKSKVKDFASIKRGDFVVHEEFGIGRYLGLETIKIGIVEQESIKIEYAEGGIVYVNMNYLGLVKKFSSQDSAVPRLSVLGSHEWKNTKRRVKAKIKEASRELISIYAKRKASEGFKFSDDSVWQKELEASFFYEDTPDQVKVTDEVKVDMESLNPMDRLVCGDVGFGKTEIAVRAAFKAVSDGKQVALLVPTTILAEQHFNTFKVRLSQFPVKVACMSRFATKARQTETLAGLKDGKVDIVIGTHRLLSKDIIFNDLGLLMIDEEHRFGVMAKEKLRAIKTNVDTLTLTATPIPRTLNLSLLGARDLSLIGTPPPNRQPIYTKVEKFDIHRVREWVLEELKRDGQIYFVHDRVQSIDKIAAYIKKFIPELNIAVAHGQMKPAELEKVIYEFLNKKFHMLIATKIIESGLDIPNVNTIIINRADRFGLAELHQLRGRVGRSDRQAYAYMLVPSLSTISQKAVKRLQAIEEYTDLGEGFNLSMRDLEIRGAGNLLGTAQSGSIDTVGFEMYVKLVDEAVDELKHEEFNEVFKDLPKQADRCAPTIDTYFEIGIPNSFMPDQADRLSFYTAMFSIDKIEEIDEIREEMEDRFGKPPVIVERLIDTAILRYHASYALFERIVVLRNKIALILPKGERENYYKFKFAPLMEFIMANYSDEVEFKQTKDAMKLEMQNKFNTIEETLKYLIKFSVAVFGELNKEEHNSN